MLTTLAHAGSSQPSHVSAGATGEKKSTYEHLFSKFGAAIPRDEVAELLSYSKTYFMKRIGDKNLEHLPWVKALKPHRVRRGRHAFFSTQAVAAFLDCRDGRDGSERQ